MFFKLSNQGHNIETIQIALLYKINIIFKIICRLDIFQHIQDIFFNVIHINSLIGLAVIPCKMHFFPY